ncbi:hypothetical protein BCD48_42455 [Pseudofrankia sp. BMG5.36]|nr:hypothetical protein BCD48_42455 [Pseudofrankia sp. BMG5.36]
MHATRHPVTTGKDISSTAFWAQSFEKRDETFAWLREHAPVSWHEPAETLAMTAEEHGEAGFWAVTRAADITYVSQNHSIFSSADEWGGVGFVPRPSFSGSGGEPNFLVMDPPNHTQYRQVMSAAFTPKAVGRLSAKIAERAAQIVGGVVGAGEIDFVTGVAARLPMLTVADLIGVPESLIEEFAHAGDNWINALNPEIVPAGKSPFEFMLEQQAILRKIGVDLVDYRRKHPADDVATALAGAEVDGRRITDDQIESIMVLLSIAGNDTTKQTTTLSTVSLWRNPDQKARLMQDFDGRIASAIEEFVRHACPVLTFGRTATKDTEIHGVQVDRGDKLVLFYGSGNRDESVFEDPHRFDLSRGRSPHVAFGGGGVHYCLGNGVAKAQLRALFSEILTKLPNMEVGEPEFSVNAEIRNVKRLPVRIP